MSKQTFRLGLNRETVRELSAEETEAVAAAKLGGSLLTCPCIPSSLPLGCGSC
jgi:hypothetical protein